MKSKLFLSLSLLPLFNVNEGNSFTSGTSIAVYVSASKILIASDSKQVTKYTGNGMEHEDQTIKIHSHNNIWYAFAGLNGYYDTNKKKEIFNPNKDFNEFLDKSASPATAFDNFKSHLQNVFKPIITDMLSSKTHDYWSSELDNRVIFEMIMVAFKNGAPMFGYFKIGVIGSRQNWKVDISSEYKYIPMNQDNANIYILGSLGSIIKFYKDGLNWPAKANTPQSKINHLVDLEIKGNPVQCGGLIRIVQLNPDGKTTWLQNPPH